MKPVTTVKSSRYCLSSIPITRQCAAGSRVRAGPPVGCADAQRGRRGRSRLPGSVMLHDGRRPMDAIGPRNGSKRRTRRPARASVAVRIPPRGVLLCCFAFALSGCTFARKCSSRPWPPTTRRSRGSAKSNCCSIWFACDTTTIRRGSTWRRLPPSTNSTRPPRRGHSSKRQSGRIRFSYLHANLARPLGERGGPPHNQPNAARRPRNHPRSFHSGDDRRDHFSRRN